MTLIKRAMSAVFVLAAAQAAQASVIQTVNGFVPLQYTKNMSIGDFYAGVGGWNSNYHLASQAELSQFLQSQGIYAHDYSSATVRNDVRYIIGFGGVNGAPGGFQTAAAYTLDAYVSVGFRDAGAYSMEPNCIGYVECTRVYADYSQQNVRLKSADIGLFLVEGAAVPEPGSLALLGLAIPAMLLGRRRRAAK
jgi:hypothetical protein